MKFKLQIIISAFILLSSHLLFGQIDSIQTEKIYNWTLNLNDLTIQRSEVDTSLYLFHNYNPILEKTITANYLGNMGSPAQTNIYYDRRKFITNFIFGNSYGLYFHLLKDQLYYNTKRQYTLLEYSTAGPKTESEQLLHIIHTQNVNKNFNFGVNYNMISSDGRYYNQQVRQNNITLFSSYKNKSYTAHVNYNLNRVKSQENGGIDSLWYLGADQYNNRINIPVKLYDAGSNVLMTGFNIAHKYEFGKKYKEIKITERKVDPNADERAKNKSDLKSGIKIINQTNLKNQSDALINADSIKIEYDTTYVERIEYSGFSLSHQYTYNNDVRKYFDETLVDSFYNSKQFYISKSKTNDQVYQKQFGNRIAFNYNNSENISASVSFFNEKINYLYKIIPDTLVKTDFEGEKDTSLVREKDWNVFNNSISFYLKGRLFKDFKLIGYSECFISGDKKKNNTSNLNVEYNIYDNHIIGIGLNYLNSLPDYLYRNYSSNHYQWNNNLSRTVEWDVSIFYKNSDYKLLINVRYGEIDNYLYLDENINVNQYSKRLNIFTGTLNKLLFLGPFRSVTKFVYQKSSNDTILSIPEYSLYELVYFEKLTKFKSTGGEMLWQIGVDYRFNSAYYADAYSPIVGLFYRQNDIKLENYHCFNIFINVEIKRMRLYFKYNYINSALNDKYYFNSPYYPSPQPVFQFGLGWTFFD